MISVGACGLDSFGLSLWTKRGNPRDSFGNHRGIFVGWAVDRGSTCLTSGPKPSDRSSRWSSRRTGISGCVRSNAWRSMTAASGCARRTATTRSGSRTIFSRRSSRIWSRAPSGPSRSTSRCSRIIPNRSHPLIPTARLPVRAVAPGSGGRCRPLPPRARPSWSTATPSTSSSSAPPISSRTPRPAWWPRRPPRAGTPSSSTAAWGWGRRTSCRQSVTRSTSSIPSGPSPS